MYGKPLILLTNDSNFFATRGAEAPKIMSPKAYGAAIAAAGGVPILTCEQSADALLSLCDGLILSGGDDIEPELFGAQPMDNGSVCIDTERSRFEVPLARMFLDAGKPVFGICRGFQLLNCILGGTLWQDLPSECGLCHWGQTMLHPLTAKEGSLLHSGFGERFMVNSAHHQAIRTLAPELIETARADDGIIEAFEHKRLPVFGVQFHPERMAGQNRMDGTPDFLPLFGHLIGLAAQGKHKNAK